MNKKIKFIIWLLSFLIMVFGINMCVFATLGYEPAKAIVAILGIILFVVVMILGCVAIAIMLYWVIME